MAEFSRKALLERLLDTTLSNLSEAEPEKSASLIKEARFIGQELAELNGETGGVAKDAGTPIDELRKRREERRKGRA
ncbi:hypothetical protein [Arcanobacterium phocae]|uniref:hypothetical protein n=1 Tax=Arcanobacterium phocae TaxID=131112 RepID=UPI001C0EF31E|nr:hypothetical protein [Arcanobacterium phocae]